MAGAPHVPGLPLDSAAVTPDQARCARDDCRWCPGQPGLEFAEHLRYGHVEPEPLVDLDLVWAVRQQRLRLRVEWL